MTCSHSGAFLKCGIKCLKFQDLNHGAAELHYKSNEIIKEGNKFVPSGDQTTAPWIYVIKRINVV